MNSQEWYINNFLYWAMFLMSMIVHWSGDFKVRATGEKQDKELQPLRISLSKR